MKRLAVVTENESSIDTVSYKDWVEKETSYEVVSMSYKDLIENETLSCRDFILIDKEEVIQHHVQGIRGLKAKGANVIWIAWSGIISDDVLEFFYDDRKVRLDKNDSLYSLLALADNIKDPLGNIYVVK